ncbi:hypothetical protein AMK16_00945 [Streptomyces sp. CB00455]|uniref:hypothetical protein n=1 Tax=Streptomyces sp. CB00455 TaxID=1703927 RepID=UPI00093C03E6|nr:hypothetical protein [Streptomyces sp. CB00455]OKK21866.1 hypothetical protein AMK16_00945 [Streptomyces sp. CB00455]
METPFWFRWVALAVGAFSLLGAYAALRRYRAATAHGARRPEAVLDGADALLGAALCAAIAFERYGLGVCVLAVQGVVLGAKATLGLRRRRAVLKPPAHESAPRRPSRNPGPGPDPGPGMPG